MPPPLAIVYTDQNSVNALLSADGVNLRLNDNQDSQIDNNELSFLTNQAVHYATDRCNLYLMGRYEPNDLASSWIVNDWATVIAARWLCARRGNDIPKSLERLYSEIMEELDAVRTGEMNIQTISERFLNGPAWSNVRVTPHYRLRRMRVERPLSQQGNPGYHRRNIDYYADALEWER